MSEIPTFKTKLSNENFLPKCNHWIKFIRSIYSNENNSEKTNVNQRLYSLQEIQAKMFFERNGQERQNQCFFKEIYSQPPERNHEIIKTIVEKIDDNLFSHLVDIVGDSPSKRKI